jgi:hypothetical protein
MAIKSYSDEELIQILTDGRVDQLPLTFVINGAIFTWHPRTGGYLGCMDDNHDRHVACQDFLRRRGQSFSSLDDVRAYGIARAFPNLEKFLESIDNWKQRVKA